MTKNLKTSERHAYTVNERNLLRGLLDASHTESLSTLNAIALSKSECQRSERSVSLGHSSVIRVGYSRRLFAEPIFASNTNLVLTNQYTSG